MIYPDWEIIYCHNSPCFFIYQPFCSMIYSIVMLCSSYWWCWDCKFENFWYLLAGCLQTDPGTPFLPCGCTIALMVKELISKIRFSDSFKKCIYLPNIQHLYELSHNIPPLQWNSSFLLLILPFSLYYFILWFSEDFTSSSNQHSLCATTSGPVHFSWQSPLLLSYSHLYYPKIIKKLPEYLSFILSYLLKFILNILSHNTKIK